MKSTTPDPVTGAPVRVAILGLPNTGKSQIFNEISGAYNIVANYPLTTVDLTRASTKIGDEQLELIDTPGLHSLYIHSEEELAVRDFIFNERPDRIVQCIDAHRFKQSLALTLDLIELGIPFGIILNTIEETEATGIQVDAQRLAGMLGVPVYDNRMKAARGTRVPGTLLEELKTSSFTLSYGSSIRETIAKIEDLIPPDVSYSSKLAVLLAEGDRYALAGGGSAIVEADISRLRSAYRGNLVRDIAKRRRSILDVIYAQSIAESKRAISNFALNFARIARHPIYGLPLLGVIVLVTYLLVVNVAGLIEGFLSGIIVDPIVTAISEGISSPFFRDALVGDYGLLTLGVFNAFVTVLPILSVYFLIMGFIEDIGYLPNLTVLTRRVLGKIGLSGRSIMSLILGFGCKTMATLTTRGIASRRERYISIYLIAFAIPCSAQLAIDMAILGRVGFLAFIIAYGTLAIVEIGAGYILNKILKEEERADFIQELPPIRLPDIGAILKKTGYRLYWFLKEAVPIFAVASVVLFLADFSGILTAAKTFLNPVVIGWLGLPIDIVEVLILSLARHEAAAGFLLRMVDNGELNYVQSIVAVVITTMFVPCFANIVAMCKQLGVGKGLVMTLSINGSAFILAGVLNWILVAIF